MRMRSKKNRDIRLEKVSHMMAAVNEEGGLEFEQTYGRTAPFFLEIGCGKGAFACGLAEKHPDANILALERVPDVLLMAMEKAAALELPHLFFCGADAEGLDALIPAHTVDRLFLNFSDPWPRKKHAKRRLTSPLFLERYKRILKPGAPLCFKTDNAGLFEYSLETMEAAGFELRIVCRDLHNDPLNQQNIMTEYEKTFSEKGFNIQYVEAYLLP